MDKVSLIDIEETKGWSIVDGRLSHKTGRYFSIVGCKRSDSEIVPMIDQPEHGILGWVLFNDECVPMLLVQNKFEPGNIGGKQMTCTVQATKSNSDRIHCGKQTEYISLFDGVGFTLQSEQGSSYIRKLNRNAIVSVDECPELRDGFTVLPANSFLKYIMMDFKTTADARSSLVCSDWSMWIASMPMRFMYSYSRRDNVGVHGQCDIDFPEIVPVERCNSKSVRIVFVDVFSDSRETERWQQPLLENVEPVVHDICVDLSSEPISVLLSPVIEPGLRCRQYGPSSTSVLPNKSREPSICEVWQSEEGGRFWKSLNLYRLVSRKKDSNKEWFTLGQIQDMALKNEVLTNEARSCIALMLSYLLTHDDYYIHRSTVCGRQ